MTNAEQVMLRTSERTSYKTCRQAWDWAYNHKLKSIATKPALRFGDLAHQSLQHWYIPGRKRGVLPAVTFEKLYNEQIEAGMDEFDIRLDDEEEWANALELGIVMMRGYVDHYGTDDHINVIAPELPFQYDILDSKGRYLVTYVGQFDLLFEDMAKKQIGLIETKTAAHISTAHLGLDEQGGSYWTFAPLVLQASGLLKRGRDLDFVLYNFLRKGKPDERPRNEAGIYLNKPTKDQLMEECANRGIVLGGKRTNEAMAQALAATGVQVHLLGSPSKRQPPPLFHRERTYRDTIDRQRLMRRVEMEAWEMKQVRAGKLPIYKNPRLTWPDQHCNACQFRDMCEVHETGGDWKAIRDATMTTWDPYEAHDDYIMED